MNTSQLLLGSSTTIVIAVSISLFVFVVVSILWQYFEPKLKKKDKNSKSSVKKENKDTANLLFNNDGKLKVNDRDFDEYVKPKNEIVNNDLIEEDEDVKDLKVITKESLKSRLSSLEDLPIPNVKGGNSLFDDDFIGIDKIDVEEEDNSVKGQFKNLTPEMKAIVFTNLLDRKE